MTIRIRDIDNSLQQVLPQWFELGLLDPPNDNPWDQRLCAIPNGDLYESVKKGKAKIVTDHIDHFTDKGIKLESGEELEADIVAYKAIRDAE